MMTTEEKKAYLLFKSVIFHYHGLDEDEQEMLEETATNIDGEQELKWAQDLISENYYDAFERAREYLGEVMMTFEPQVRLSHLAMVWDANQKKGYVSELEAAAMLILAKDWEVEIDFVASIKKRS